VAVSCRARDRWDAKALRAVRPGISFLRGLGLVCALGPSRANAVDGVSFAIMRKLSIRKAFSFDNHFRSAGFDTLL
jgi:hypothetical protein